MPLVIGIDTGGTFTDVVGADTGTGRVTTLKIPSTPADPSHAFLAGISKVLETAGAAPEDVRLVAHGTTVATNAIVESKGARAALVTTEKFRYVMEIGRQDIPRGVNLYRWQKPERPVPPDLVFEVRERIGADGSVIEPLDEGSVRAAAGRIRAAGVAAVGVCTLHSYINADHERRIAEILSEELPEVHVTASTDVLPSFREYERSLLTAMNATVMPLMSRYIMSISRGLKERRVDAPFMIMKSNGGVSGAETIAAQPVYTALSGLAAGVQGACLIGRAAGHPNLISLDIGGTSTDVAICPTGEPVLAPETEISSLPLKIQSVDVRTIGAGGGSIAALLPGGGLAVGPESAGADPGPVCYGRGGRLPTVTDAQVVLRRLPEKIAGGAMSLDRNLASAAIAEQIATPLSLTVEQAANGIVEILTHNIAGAVRGVSIERGHDPAQYTLMALGGAGPLHALRLAEVLGMTVVVFPRYPGVLSALGLLATPLRQDYVRTVRQTGPSFEVDGLQAALDLLEEGASDWFDRENMAAEHRSISRFLDVRYPNQGHELQMPLPGEGALSLAALSQVEREFHDLHEKLYGFALRASPLQITSVRIAAIGDVRGLTLTPREPAGAAAPQPASEREVYIDDTHGYRVCPAYDRAAIEPGMSIEGPAVVDQLDTTIFVRPGWTALADVYDNLVASRAGAPA